MIRFGRWLAFPCLAATTVVSAQQACPWITSGTVDALLQGAPTLQYTAASSGGSCKFRLDQNGTITSLNIEISNSRSPSCNGNTEKLTGIGNEASLCSIVQSNQQTYSVTGRVRATYFSAMLLKHDDVPHGIDDTKQTIERIAEQVVGNLY